MGLDVYVGSLTRYYAHDWETIIQQAGRTQGFKVEIIRTEPEPPDTITDPQELQTGIRSWRDSLSGQLRDATIIESDLDWDERADASYFTDKPDWDCFGALVLLAAYEEEPKPLFGSRWPKKIAKDWERDGRLAARLNSESPPRYAHLYGCEVWLPVQLGVPFGGVMPSGPGGPDRIQRGAVGSDARPEHQDVRRSKRRPDPMAARDAGRSGREIRA